MILVAKMRAMRTRERAVDCGYRTGLLLSDSAGRRHSEGQHNMQAPLQLEPFPSRLRTGFSGGSNLNFFYCSLLLVACGSIPSHLSKPFAFPLLYSVPKVVQLIGFLFLLCVIPLAGSSGSATNVFVLTKLSPSFLFVLRDQSGYWLLKNVTNLFSFFFSYPIHECT